MKQRRVESRQDFVSDAASPLIRPCPSDPDCNWDRFDSWHLLDSFDEQPRRKNPASNGDSIQHELLQSDNADSYSIGDIHRGCDSARCHFDQSRCLPCTVY